MKAPAFGYVKPRSLDEAFQLLARHGEEARPLAGGQSLLPALNMRLSEPRVLVDLAALPELAGIAVQGSVLRIGALVTHAEIESSPLVARHAPLLARAAPHIAHHAIRNLGTLGGSVAHADPAAEWPACLVALEGVVVARGAGGERRIPARDFFIGLYRTALAAGEIVAACEVPLHAEGDLVAFDEFARRRGDFAIVGLALALRREAQALRRVRLAFLGVGSTPVRVPRTEAVLEGKAAPKAAQLDQAIDTLRDEIDPPADLTHSSATKRHLACVLARRMLTAALAA